MKLSPGRAVAGLVLFAGCGRDDPYKVGDGLEEKADHTMLGTVVEVGDHTFASGVRDRSVRVQLAKDATRQDRYVMQVLTANYDRRSAP